MIFSKFNKNIIFVIGSGRSGTHLLGRTFENSPEIDAFIEDDLFFETITDLAVGLNKNKSNLNKVLKRYKKVFNKSEKQYILEKTHPNIWFVEEILEFFPNAKFIGIKRNVLSTVASMINHKGVLSWYKRLPLDEVNPFLGITESNKDAFKKLPLESKCTFRWISHTNRLEYLENKYPKHVKIVDYEDFYDNYNGLMNILKEFLDLDFNLNSETLNQSGKDKWKTTLSQEQVNNIHTVINNQDV